jgi:hypothetical protein
LRGEPSDETSLQRASGEKPERIEIPEFVGGQALVIGLDDDECVVWRIRRSLRRVISGG